MEQSVAYRTSQRVRRGATWIGVLAVVFGLGAPFNAAVQMVRGNRELAKLSAFDDSALLPPIHGRVFTVAQFRERTEARPMATFIGGLVVAGLMALLWRWARRAPLPALSAALAVFVAEIVFGAVKDPDSIWSGIVVKVLGLGALLQGLRATLEERAATSRD